jgi:hypothetical protein
MLNAFLLLCPKPLRVTSPGCQLTLIAYLSLFVLMNSHHAQENTITTKISMPILGLRCPELRARLAGLPIPTWSTYWDTACQANIAAPQYFTSLLAVSSQLSSDTTVISASYFSCISCFGICDPLLTVLIERRRIVVEPSSRCTGPCYSSFWRDVALDAFRVPEIIHNQNALSPSVYYSHINVK